MLNRIISNLDGTLVVTQEWNLIAMNSIVLQRLPHPKELSTTTCRGHIVAFGGGERYIILLLGRPTNQGPTKKLASPGS
jgi:membrane-associated PAP2 superfamily phosphatase